MAASVNCVWITGAGGLIGNEILQHAPEFFPGAKIIGLQRNELDLTDFPKVRERFQQDQPDSVFHCAALSKSPACEANPHLAWKINIEATAHLAHLAAAIPFFFFSTDLVFDGARGNYSESDSVNPLNVYAETKVAAEKIILANPKHTIIRTSLNYGNSPRGDRAFNEELFLAWQRDETVKFFTDEFRCPIPAEITARAVLEIATKNATGLFHLAGSERVSRWEIGELIAAQFSKLKPKFEKASLKNYSGAPRSPDTSLNCMKIQKLLSFPLPGFRDWLKEKS